MSITTAEYSISEVTMGFQPQLFGTAREQGGLRARAAGKEFESLILASQNDAQGPVMVLTHVKNFAKRIPEKRPEFLRLGQRMMLVEERSPFDFCGTVWGSTRSVCIDAKSLSVDYASFPLCNEQVVKPHQIRELVRQEAPGAISGFLVRSYRAGEYLWLYASQAARLVKLAKPVQWNDPAWDRLGPIRDGYGVPLRKLVELDREQGATNVAMP